ncbi:MAG: 2-phospho-L-lactate guanylyltransferase [Candidatus Rokuibacteriota bacterium]|nr:MAG: 2-phospho-L-lactate guanylyltransferase [Candidatus Rokubacteria bacterium]
MIVVAVPVKDLVNAKQRLVPVLAPAERAALAAAMLRDVLRAVFVARVTDVWVVTHDPEVERLARGFGCTIVTEVENRGHTAAVAAAQQRARDLGARVFVTVPGDVPGVTASEIDALVAAVAGEERAVAFAPSRSGRGTNGVALVPPDAMKLTFGEPSFQAHLATARRAGLVPRVLPLPGLALDVDAAPDLEALLAAPAMTESRRLVGTWPIGARVAAVATGGTAR